MTVMSDLHRTPATSTGRYYLRRNVVAEPLVDQWYAWPHLIPPATNAMNTVGRHVQIMESFLRAPQIHAAAVKNPAMLGGPFIAYPTERAGDIRGLLERTRSEQAEIIGLAKEIATLHDLLRNEAAGFSLEPLYPNVPERLRA